MGAEEAVRWVGVAALALLIVGAPAVALFAWVAAIIEWIRKS